MLVEILTSLNKSKNTSKHLYKTAERKMITKRTKRNKQTENAPKVFEDSLLKRSEITLTETISMKVRSGTTRPPVHLKA